MNNSYRGGGQRRGGGGGGRRGSRLPSNLHSVPFEQGIICPEAVGHHAQELRLERDQGVFPVFQRVIAG